MNKKKETRPTHPLDENARKGMDLYGSKEVAQQATSSFEQRLAATYPVASRRRNIRHYLAFAASVLLLIGVFGFLYFSGGSSADQWVLQDDWTISPEAPLAIAALAPNRSQTESAEQQLVAARQAYAAGQFEEAVVAFSTYLKQAANPRPETYLFLGHAQLQYAPEQASVTLSAFIARSGLDEYYRDLANWYRAWAYIRAGQRTEAQDVLTRLVAKSSPLQEDADRLLELIADPGSELVH